MTLTKADFGFLLKGVRSVMVQSQKMRIITDQQALGKPKLSGMGDNVKKDMHLVVRHGTNRRITSMNSKGMRNEYQIPTIIKRLGKFMSESLYFSLYGRMYRDMLINEIKIMEYGDSAARIMRENNEYSSAVDAIRTEVRVILEKEAAFRSTVENLFICGLLRQKNGVRDRLTNGWPAHQFNDLCRTIKIVRVKPMKRVSDESVFFFAFFVFIIIDYYFFMTENVLFIVNLCLLLIYQ